MKIIAVLLFFVFFNSAKVVYGKYVLHDDKHTVKYKCNENEDLDVLYDGDGSGEYLEITSLVVSSCNSANLTAYMGISIDSRKLTSIRVENIKNKVEFIPGLSSVELKNIEFLNIGEIEKFDGDMTFSSFNKLDKFIIESTHIGEFDQSFNEVEVNMFELKDVVILKLRVLDLSSSNGTRLKIIDSVIYVDLLKPNDSLNFAYFDRITITNSMFIFQHGGNISISGREIHLLNNVFINASVNVVGREIHVHGTCADGPSSTMRLHVDNSTDHRNHENIIFSERNRLPSGIIYASHHRRSKDNTVCPNAKCNCLVTKPMRPVHGYNNFANSHHDTSRGFFLHFIVIASAIFTRI